MPHFSVLEVEDEVQLDDKTRLDATKCFTTNNQSEFTKLSIKPSGGDPFLDAFDAQAKERFIDWQYADFEIDINSTNNKLNFSRGGMIFTATITDGTYSLTDLCTEVALRMNGADANTYSCSVDAEDQFTISGAAAFELLIATGANKLTSILTQLFFGADDLTGELTYTGERIEYLTRQVTATVGDDVSQVQTVTAVADVAASLQNKYFYLYSTNDAVKYYVWFNVATLGVDPAPAGATGITVAIASGATATAVATAIASAVDASASFSATSGLAVVTITNSTVGFASSAYNFNATGFTFALTTGGQAAVSQVKYVKVYTEMGDYLWSSDDQLKVYEIDIRKWIMAGRSTHKNAHRRAQKEILQWLDRQGYINIDREKLTKWDIRDVSEVNEWATFTALKIIYYGISNSKDDVFEQKAIHYEDREIVARARAILRLDFDKDGVSEPDEGIDPYSMRVAFR